MVQEHGRVFERKCTWCSSVRTFFVLLTNVVRMSTRMLLNSRFALAHRYNDPKIVSLVHDLAFKSQIKLNVEFFEMLLDLSRVCTSPVRYNHTIEKQMDTSWLSSTSISACVASIRPQVLYPNGVACGRSFTTVANVESSSSSPTRTTSHGNSPLWTSLPSATLHRSRYARIDTEPRAVVSLTKISNQDESGMKRVRSLPLLQNTTKKMSNNDLTEPSLHRRLRSASREKSPIHIRQNRKARGFFAESKDKSITNQNALLTSGIPLVSFFALLPFLSSSSKMRIVRSVRRECHFFFLCVSVISPPITKISHTSTLQHRYFVNWTHFSRQILVTADCCATKTLHRNSFTCFRSYRIRYNLSCSV